MRTRLFIRRHIDVLAIGVLLLSFGVFDASHEVVARRHEIVERLRVERTRAIQQLHQRRRVQPVCIQSIVAKWIRIV